MPGKASNFYWDACVFLAWIKDEKRAPGEMEGVTECIELFEKNAVNIVTSALTLTEVTAAKVPDDAIRILDRLLRRRNATVVDVDRKISRLASELRDFYLRDRDKWNGLTLSTPDAIHLATAIIYRVDEFHTFDGRNNHGSLGLLPLDGDVAGRRLKIDKPSGSRQIPLDLRGVASEPEGNEAEDGDEGADSEGDD